MGTPIRCYPFFSFDASERLSRLPTAAACGRRFSFQRCLDYFAVLPGNGPLDFQYATDEINVRPFQSQQFAAPKSGGEVEVVELVHAAVLSLMEEGAELVGGQRFHLLVFDFWQCAALCWIFRDETLFEGEVVCRPDHLMNVPHGFRC